MRKKSEHGESIVIIPPEEGASMEPDEDSDGSDNAVSGEFADLPRRSLNAED